jgi:hypothetical protein
MYATETSGVWGPPSDATLPGTTGSFWAVSCASALDCTAVGGDYGTNEAFYEVDSGGVWSTPHEVATTGTTGLFYGVSCPDAGHCMAVGWDEGTDEPFYDDLGASSSPPTTATTTSGTTTTTTAPTTTTTTTTPVVAPPPSTLTTTVGFATGSATLSGANRSAIDRFLVRLVSERRHSVIVSGFASPGGPSSENAHLIRARAAVVARYVHTILQREHAAHVVVKIHLGDIRHSTDPSKDQVATLSA